MRDAAAVGHFGSTLVAFMVGFSGIDLHPSAYIFGGSESVEDCFARGLMTVQPSQPTSTQTKHQLPLLCHQQFFIGNRLKMKAAAAVLVHAIDSSPLRKKICLLRDASKLRGAIYLP